MTPEEVRRALNGRTGIYIMTPKPGEFSTAVGHATIWTGTDVFGTNGHSYLESAAKVTPMEFQQPKNISGSTPSMLNDSIQSSFYLYDHLGNTRVVYTPKIQCPTFVEYQIDFAADYYPYGKSLRQFVGADEKFLTTQHERDIETGLDYRGARFYDSDVARFLSTDPWQDKYPTWSTYNYVMGNPLAFTDPTGKGVEGDFFDASGNHLGSDGKKDGKIYLVNGTSKFNSSNFEEGGKYDGNHTGFHKDNGDGYSVSEVGADSEIGLLARIGFAEFRGSNDAEQQAGMDITLNRVSDSRYPNTLEGVIKAPYQYSSLNSGDPNKPFFENPASKIKTSVINERAWVKSVSNAIKVSQGEANGISQGATLYYSPRSMAGGRTPKWNFNKLTEVKIKGVRESHIKAYKYK